MALVSTLLVSWAANSSNDPTPQRKNLNPYSAKNSDLFGSFKTPVKVPVAVAGIIPAAVPDIAEDTKHIIAVRNSWLRSTSYLRVAMFLINLQSRLFDELANRSVSQAMAPVAGIEIDLVNGHRFFWFMEGLCGAEYLAYLDSDTKCMDVAAALSRSAVRNGLPAIRDGLLEEHPMRSDPDSITGQSEALGGAAAVYIARKVDCWRVYLIGDGSESSYIGVVSLFNADTFIKKMSDWFAQFNNSFTIVLLGEKG